MVTIVRFLAPIVSIETEEPCRFLAKILFLARDILQCSSHVSWQRQASLRPATNVHRLAEVVREIASLVDPPRCPCNIHQSPSVAWEMGSIKRQDLDHNKLH
jgi:hypothetical protein